MSVGDEDVDLQSWGWTDLSSYSSSVWDSEKEHQDLLLSGIMSRRSLRLDEGLLDRSLPQSSASFSVGGGSWKSTRSLKSRRSQHHSVSCSESVLLNTPHKASSQSLLNSSLPSVASDASLLSSLLDESSVQETTLVDTFWGLDQDVDPKESTVIEQSTGLADRTLIGSDGRCPKHLVQTLGRVYCKDCELHSVSAYCSSSPSGMETSTIYSRDRSRKTRIDVLQLWLDCSLLCVRRAAASCLSALTHTWQVCRRRLSQTDNRNRARSGLFGVMDLRESTTTQKELHPNGSLCDDCQAIQRSDTHTVTSSSSSPSSSWSSVASCLLGLMWSAAVFTAQSLCQLTLRAASAVWPLIKKLFSTSRSAGRSAGETAGDVYRWLNRRQHHMTASFLTTRFPVRLLLVLLPLLLLFSLCWFGPAGLQSVLPAVNITEAVSDVPDLSSTHGFTSSQSPSAEGAVEESREVQPFVETLFSRPPAAGEEEAAPAEDEDESGRLVRLERSLATLWEQVEAGGQRAEQRHVEVLRLYADLQQQQQMVANREGVEPWMSGLLDQHLDQHLDQQLDQHLDRLRRRLDEEKLQTEQSLQKDLLQQQSQTSRLDQLELQLQTLAARTEELHRRREAATTVSPSPTTLVASVSGAVDRQSHNALLAEVARLEEALEDVRRDVKGLSGGQDSCRRLDTIQQTISAQVSAQVREEVRVLVYGNQLMVGGGAPGDATAAAAGLPESLLEWLSQQYISGANLQAALASLELSIMQNISLQLEKRRSEETVREAVLHATGAAGAAVTREDVHEIVKNALRLFSEDRTGLADYALESGGGSILSTRCSETYETKAALLSLFGLPLWYFSQSPRAVIQPDVHPGNCWAFRGSAGFLVIRLSMRILPTAFSLEHIPRILAPSGTLHSAPRDFTVYGLDDESQERGKLLGSYTYDEDGEALQTYAVTEENDRTFQIIEVQVLSNWGHQEYTCMYRFRVHGTSGDT
ncbi:SUN domain-containing protein 1-like isoform X3 [Sebastes umbrosus]|uniref:SUN domain-containing protein 1-like isoform X3 n=1 Tax=Sebastes umbrosus TaxID=72105 RepID=UPI00189F8335|nr:SUN domain-containing protein 1-like isoform X3 [Sebastes umbrosus]